MRRATLVGLALVVAVAAQAHAETSNDALRRQISYLSFRVAAYIGQVWDYIYPDEPSAPLAYHALNVANLMQRADALVEAAKETDDYGLQYEALMVSSAAAAIYEAVEALYKSETTVGEVSRLWETIAKLRLDLAMKCVEIAQLHGRVESR